MLGSGERERNGGRIGKENECKVERGGRNERNIVEKLKGV